MHKSGAIVLIGLISGLRAMPFTPFGMAILGISMLTAAQAEPAAWLLTCNRHYSMARVVMMGFVIIPSVTLTAAVHCRTVQDWVAWYRRVGLAEALRRRHGGHWRRPPRLTPEQEAQLKEPACQGRCGRLGTRCVGPKRRVG
ncbi:MAG: hypothetical protein ACK4JD_09525 [Thermoflexales bacterium]